MENRSHAILAGLFVIVLLVAGAITAIWLGKANIQYEPFDLVSRQPVGGLSVQSQVRYQGMLVGKVESLKFDEAEPGSIRIRIGVEPDTPITTDTWAEITAQGVTGISHVDLRDTGDSTERLRSTSQNVVAIPVRPGFLQRLQNTGGGMVGDMEIILKRAQGMLSQENVDAFSDVMQNARSLTVSLNESVRRLTPVADALPGAVDDLRASMATVNEAAREMESLVVAARGTFDRLNSPDGPLTQTTASLRQIERMVVQVQSNTLPVLQQVLQDVGAASAMVARSVKKLESSPQSLIFGPAPVAPGPGEPGFAGFSD